MDIPWILVILVSLALIFDYLNGFHDSSNIVATIIFSRAMQPRTALIVAAIAEFCGPFIFGVAVAKTIGGEIVPPTEVTEPIILAALISAIIWNITTWYLGIPSSSSHALIGGLVGAVSFSLGFQSIQAAGIIKVIIALFLSPILGMLVGFLLTKLTFFLAQKSSRRINWFFRNSQVLTGIGLALSHGTNDAQKTMGIITMGLIASGYLDSFVVPTWVVAVSAAAISLGIATGGWRLIHTLGGKFYRIRPVHGFCSQVTSSSIILGAALLGGPVSTTQVVSSAILGVGSAQRINMVRWGVAGEIATAWLLTIPANIALSAGIYWVITNL